MRVLGAVLAGGVGRRFGGDKALAEIDGQTLLTHVIEGLRSQTDAIVVCGRPLVGLTSLDDRPAPGLGPMAGIAAALFHASAEGFDAVLTAPCDTPFLPPDLRRHLDGPPAYLADLPLIGLWPSALAGSIDAALADRAQSRSVRAWAAGVGARAVAADPIANVNTPDDLARLLRDGAAATGAPC